jgi:hypothetical protein
MIDKDNLKYGDIIWQVDINGSDVILRKINVGHLYQIAGSYWVSAEQQGSMDGIMLKADSHLLFYTKSEAIDFAIDLRDNLNKVIREPL